MVAGNIVTGHENSSPRACAGAFTIFSERRANRSWEHIAWHGMAFFHTPERAPPAEEHAPLRQPTAPTNFIIISLYFTDFQEIKQLALFLLSLDNTFFYLFRQLISFIVYHFSFCTK